MVVYLKKKIDLSGRGLPDMKSLDDYGKLCPWLNNQTAFCKRSTHDFGECLLHLQLYHTKRYA